MLAVRNIKSRSRTSISETSIDGSASDILEESSAFISHGGTIPKNILEFNHSYGYDCKRLFNLCLIDQQVLIFSSGNLLHFLTIKTRRIKTRRTIGGGGIGYITVII